MAGFSSPCLASLAAWRCLLAMRLASSRVSALAIWASFACAPSVAQRRGSRLSESSKIRKQNALAAPRSGLVGCSHISHTLAASNPAMEFVMIRLILFAWFALAAILLVATNLSEDHHLKQISSTYFAQNDNYQTRHTIHDKSLSASVALAAWRCCSERFRSSQKKMPRSWCAGAISSAKYELPWSPLFIAATSQQTLNSNSLLSSGYRRGTSA